MLVKQNHRPLNIIVVISDTLRLDHLGCYGNTKIRTPNLDKFAQMSVVFDRAYCGSFPTIPSRTDLFTGKWTFPPPRLVSPTPQRNHFAPIAFSVRLHNNDDC